MFRRAWAWACLLGLLISAPTALAQSVFSPTSSVGVSAQPLPVQFEGEVVLIPEVYRSVLHYAGWENAPADAEGRATWIERTLEDFLHASGYELASVVVVQNADGQYELLIDEGRLDKIIFRNVDPWITVQLIFLLDLPGKVFNRDLVERRLQRVREKMSVKRIGYEVVPLDEPEHRRLQLDDPGIIEGLTLLRPGEPHELRISFERADRRAGFQLGLGIQAPDGLVVEGSYLAPSVLARRDRVEVSGRVGVRLSDIGTVPGNRIGLSQAGLGILWSSPGDILRFTAGASGNLEARRREDLEIVNYFFAPIRAALGFSLEGDEVLFRVLGGIEEQIFFGPRTETEAVVPVLLNTREFVTRPFAQGSLHIDFNHNRLRRDRPHDFDIQGRYLWSLSDEAGDIREISGQYRNTITIGFDEFRYKLKGVWMDGDVPFFLEVPMGEGFLRSAFQGTVFARQIGALDLEYRFSLSRDTLKLSLFNDLATYQSLDLVREPEGLRLIDNFGVGVHVLLIDAFQINTYFGLGIRSDGETEVGFSLDIAEAF